MVWFISEVIANENASIYKAGVFDENDFIISDELFARLQNTTDWDSNGDVEIDG